jgi:predicted nucleotidyltransferase
MKAPLGPEDVVEALRERIKREDLTLTASDAVRIILMLERLSQRCAEAYQVVGSLAGLAEVMDDPAVQKALDLFSVPTRPGDVLPFVTRKDRQRVIPKRRTKAKSSPKTASKKGGRKSRS